MQINTNPKKNTAFVVILEKNWTLKQEKYCQR